MRMLSKRNLIIGIIWAATVIGPSSFFYYQYQQAQNLLNNPVDATKAEIQTVTQKVGSVIELPKDETPSLATVSDLSKVSAQPFFAKAALGDKVLIYSKAQLAVLYRPSTGKIIEISSLVAGT